MPYSVNHVLKLTMVLQDERFPGYFKNILHFRGVEATMNFETMQSFIDGVCSGYFERYFANLCDKTYLREMKMENLTDLNEPAVSKLFDIGDHSGELAEDIDDVPQAAACITRKSFIRGRKGIGHLYFGPLPSTFVVAGQVSPDPIGFGELTDVLDALGDPLLDTETGWEARPIVCGATGAGVVPNNDVRIQTIAPLVVYLKSRRPGVGE